MLAACRLAVRAARALFSDAALLSPVAMWNSVSAASTLFLPAGGATEADTRGAKRCQSKGRAKRTSAEQPGDAGGRGARAFIQQVRLRLQARPGVPRVHGAHAQPRRLTRRGRNKQHPSAQRTPFAPPRSTQLHPPALSARARASSGSSGEGGVA